jgi:hypothetical protein
MQDICANILASTGIKDARVAEAIARRWVRTHA